MLPLNVSNCAIELPEPSEAPVTPADGEAVQLNDVAATLLVRAILVKKPEQMVAEAGEAVTTGIGLTVTVTLTAFPSHPLYEGVMAYVTVPAVLPVAVRSCIIELPVPPVAPVTPVWATVHENVAPATLLVRSIDAVVPEHIVRVAGSGETSGIGFTDMITSTDVPVHPNAEGLMVYVTVPVVLPEAVRV